MYAPRLLIPFCFSSITLYYTVLQLVRCSAAAEFLSKRLWCDITCCKMIKRRLCILMRCGLRLVAKFLEANRVYVHKLSILCGFDKFCCSYKTLSASSYILHNVSRIIGSEPGLFGSMKWFELIMLLQLRACKTTWPSLLCAEGFVSVRALAICTHWKVLFP